MKPTVDCAHNPLFSTVILAGGLATRLHPVTHTLPKSLIKINGEPFIHHQLRLLSQHGIRDIVLCVGYLGEMIEKEIGDGRKFGVQVQYSYDGSQLLGTGGAIKKAQKLVSDNFFVLYGDSYLVCDYAAIQINFMQTKKLGLMTVFSNHGKWDTSNVEYTAGKILAYDKKFRTERMQYIDYGLGIFSKNALLHIPDNEPYDLALLYQTLLKQDELAAHEVHQRFYEVGSFVGMEELEYHLAQGKKTESTMTDR